MTELHPPADPAGPPEPAGPPGPNGPTRTRRLVRVVLGLCVVGLTVHLLLPQVGQLQQTLATLRSANWGWLAVGLVASALTYAVAGASIVAAVRRPLPVGRTSAVQLAASFTAQLGPGALGRLAINQRYLESEGVSRGEAVAALGLHGAFAAVVHAAALVLTATLAGTFGLGQARIPHNWPLLAVVVAVAVAVGAAAAGIPGLRRRLLDPARQALSALHTLRRPERVAALLATTVGLTATYLVAFEAALRAFGARPGLLAVAAAYLFGSAVGAVSPTPGGLGVTEAALVASLTTIGTPAATAVAGVLAFRLLTFWLPMAPGAVALHQLTDRGIV
jgi:glycosyltransferase 2 family protein